MPLNDSRSDDEFEDSNVVPVRSRTVAAQNETVLLRAIMQAGLTPLGKAIGHDHTYIVRFRKGEQGMKLPEYLLLLEACGLKLVSAGSDMKVIDKKDYETLLNLANKGMRALNNEVCDE